MELCPDIDPDSITLAPFDEELARKYNLEEKLSKQVTGFTLIAIILALMGVLVVTVALVVARSFSAATKNPVESIKAE